VNADAKIGGRIGKDGLERELHRRDFVLLDAGNVEGGCRFALVSLEVEASRNEHDRHWRRGSGGGGANVAQDFADDIGRIPHGTADWVAGVADVREVERQEAIFEVTAVGLVPCSSGSGRRDGTAEGVDEVLGLVHEALVAELNQLLLELGLLEIDLATEVGLKVGRGSEQIGVDGDVVAVAHQFYLALDLARGDKTSRSTFGHLLDPAAHELVASDGDLVVAGDTLAQHQVDGILCASRLAQMIWGKAGHSTDGTAPCAWQSRPSHSRRGPEW